MKASDIYIRPFLKAADQQRPIKLTVADLEIGEFTDQKTGAEQKRVIMGFAGARKRLILNKTQAGVMIASFGDEMAGWPGKQVILAPGVTTNGQQTVLLSPVPEERQEGAGDADLPF